MKSKKYLNCQKLFLVQTDECDMINKYCSDVCQKEVHHHNMLGDVFATVFHWERG